MPARCPPVPKLQKHRLRGKPPNHSTVSPYQMGKLEDRKKGRKEEREREREKERIKFTVKPMTHVV